MRPAATAPPESLLFLPDAPPPGTAHPVPDYFGDLYLDQVEAALTRGRDDYGLEPYFRTRLTDVATVRERQAVFRDVDRDEVRRLLTAFATRLRNVRTIRSRAAKLHDVLPRHRWLLHAADEYCGAVGDLAVGLRAARPRSAGLVALADWLADHVAGPGFAALRSESAALVARIGGLRFNLLTRGGKITVGPNDGEPDYSEQVQATFERFRHGAVKDYRTRFKPNPVMNHIEVAILGLVAQLFPDEFDDLARFCAQHADFLDPTVVRVDRELQFYLGWFDHVAPLRRAGLTLTYPQVSDTSKEIAAQQTFDIALADNLVTERADVVTNDFHLGRAERILVVSGPNQGGKTTLARTFGQLAHLAGLGCPVPGTSARLFLPDRIFTQFEREENIETLASKLEEELARMRAMFDVATGDSLIVLNEIFNSTTVQDATELSGRVLTTVAGLDALCMCVTFIDELSVLNDKVVSMVSTVDPDDPAVRTFKVVRRVADGRAYAMAIARKYDLTYDALSQRLS